MESAGRGHTSSEQSNYGSWQQWQVSVQLLQLMQSDYQRARKQLEDVCRTFGEREYMASEHLRSALEAVTRADGQGTDGVMGSAAKTSDAPIITLGQVWKASDTTTAVAPLQVRFLGSFEVRLGWNKVDSWRSLKAKSLLKYLIAHRGRYVPKDVLMETLWPECDPQAANNNLKAAMYALRQTLNPNQNEANGNEGSSYVLFQEGNYGINPQVELWVDVDEFEHHWMVGLRLEKVGKGDEAAKAYQLAERLYRGDYLEDDPFEEWALLRREALKDIFLTILSKLGERSMQEEDCESCIAYCQKILAKDPCREDAYRGLMRCYGRLGQRNRAIAWYNICTKTIKRELDLSPEPATVEIYNKISKDEYI